MNRNGMIYIHDWSASSLDLNPIRHLWHHLKIRMDKYPLKASNADELWERFETEWNNFDQKTMESYYKGYPKRIRAVIKARGGHTTF